MSVRPPETESLEQTCCCSAVLGAVRAATRCAEQASCCGGPAPASEAAASHPAGLGEAIETRFWVVGLATAFGDDRAGWDVVARLRDAFPAGVRVTATCDPLIVADAPDGCRLLVVIDACRGAGPPGSVHRFEWPDSRLVAGGTASTHGIGLAAALQLAGALGRLPQRVIILAVEGATGGPGAGLSRAVEAALPEVTARVRAELEAGPIVPPRS